MTDKQISNFQELYKNHFSKEIDRDEVLDKGIKLVELIKIIYQPNSLTNKERDKSNAFNSTEI